MVRLHIDLRHRLSVNVLFQSLQFISQFCDVNFQLIDPEAKENLWLGKHEKRHRTIYVQVECMESGNDLHQKRMENDTSSHLVKKSSSLSPVILFYTCLEVVGEACNAEIANLLRLQLTPDSVHKLLLATASLLLGWVLVSCQYWIRKTTDYLNWLINCQSKQSTFVASSFLHQPSCKKVKNKLPVL